MNQEVRSFYSNILGRDMEYKVYGYCGKPVFIFAPQDGRYWDYESFNMIDEWMPELEAGKVQLIGVDSIDQETWSDKWGDPYRRSERHEQWVQYVLQELIPDVKAHNAYEGRYGATGCSMGAYHAANFIFRAPMLFDLCIAQSGFYDAQMFFGDFMDEKLYYNSPIDCLPNMPEDHEYMQLYKTCKIIICIGQGAWEEELLASTRRLDAVCKAKGIDVWFDYWGYDVNHDWPWWHKQLRYFLDTIQL